MFLNYFLLYNYKCIIRKSSKNHPKVYQLKLLHQKETHKKNMDVMNLLLLMTLITLVAGYYYIYSKNLNVESFSNANLDPKEGEIVMVLFYTNWCPIVLNLTNWRFKIRNDNQKVGNNNVRIESDCTNPDLGKNIK